MVKKARKAIVKNKKHIRLVKNKKKPVVVNKELTASYFRTNATLLRSELLTKLLNPGKDINFECGYPDTISREEYKALYGRNGIANRVVRVLPEETWAMPPEILENENADETDFEKKWKEIQADRRIFYYLQRIDVLSGIGEFGVLLLGLNDGKPLSDVVEGINEITGLSEYYRKKPGQCLLRF